MKLFEIVLQGRSPLLMNKMSEEILISLTDKTKKASKTAAKPSLEEQAASKVYVVDGAPVIPVQNLMASLIECGKYIRLDGKRQLSTSSSSMLPGFLFFEDQHLPLLDVSNGSQGNWGVAQWRYSLMQGRNPNGGEAVPVVRPMFERWGCVVRVQLDTESIPESTFRQLFDWAGLRVGLMDFRPARKGTFGQFIVRNWNEIDFDLQVAA
jgi:hypothetical protein